MKEEKKHKNKKKTKQFHFCVSEINLISKLAPTLWSDIAETFVSSHMNLFSFFFLFAWFFLFFIFFFLKSLFFNYCCRGYYFCCCNYYYYLYHYYYCYYYFIWILTILYILEWMYCKNYYGVGLMILLDISQTIQIFFEGMWPTIK